MSADSSGGRKRVLVATRNAGKVAELRPMLEAAGYEPVDLTVAGIVESDAEAAVECHDSFAENALAKARYFARWLAEGAVDAAAVLADDSGIEVDALGGAPGVHSRRWAAQAGEGEGLEEAAANNARLMRLMNGVSDRRARFVCAAAWVEPLMPGARELVRSGAVEGVILHERSGEGGFGYDPYFYSPELGCGFGEATREAKARVSHRARAVAALLEAVRQEG